ncbi:MAG: tetratricopeptide repeat protein [Actinomycetota bacterium]
MSVSMTERTVEELLQTSIALKVEGRYDEAEREIAAILAVQPNHPAARRELGLVLGFKGMFDESLAELRRAVELDEGYLDARNDLALTYSMLGMVDEARGELEAVLEIDPTNATALRHIVYFR